MPGLTSYKIFPLGDQAITIEFGNKIHEQVNMEVVARFHEWTKNPFPGMKELVPAYCTITVYYDPIVWRKKASAGQTAYDRLKSEIEERLTKNVTDEQVSERLVRIPVCYEPEFAPDIYRVAGAKEITVEELIAIHGSRNYKVYMLGFLPGFAYMGEVDERIVVPRKPQPANIIAGSVGIAGKQTGIYPLNSPGGWQIIGRTPLKLFDPGKEQPIFLQAGDRVKFYPINKNEFAGMLDSGREKR